MGARHEFLPPLVQVDLLAAELERQALLVRRAERLELHAQHVDIEVDARFLVPRGEHDVVDVVDHFIFSSLRGLYSRTVSARWLTTLLAKRTNPRSPFDVRRCSVT